MCVQPMAAEVGRAQRVFYRMSVSRPLLDAARNDPATATGRAARRARDLAHSAHHAQRTFAPPAVPPAVALERESRRRLRIIESASMFEQSQSRGALPLMAAEGRQG